MAIDFLSRHRCCSSPLVRSLISLFPLPPLPQNSREIYPEPANTQFSTSHRAFSRSGSRYSCDTSFSVSSELPSSDSDSGEGHDEDGLEDVDDRRTGNLAHMADSGGSNLFLFLAWRVPLRSVHWQAFKSCPVQIILVFRFASQVQSQKSKGCPCHIPQRNLRVIIALRLLLQRGTQAVPRGPRTALAQPPRAARPCARIRCAHTSASTSNDPSSSSSSQQLSPIHKHYSLWFPHRPRRLKGGVRSLVVRLSRRAMSLGVHRPWKDSFLRPGSKGLICFIGVAGGKGELALRILDQ